MAFFLIPLLIALIKGIAVASTVVLTAAAVAALVDGDDVQYASDWMRQNGHPYINEAIILFNRFRNTVRRVLVVRTNKDSQRDTVIRESEMPLSELPSEVQQILNREGTAKVDVTHDLKMKLSY